MKARRWDTRKMGRAEFTRQIAFHEAGHAMTAILQGRRFDYVTIIPDGKLAGHCAFSEPPVLRWKNRGGMARVFNNAIRVCLAGIVGEIIGSGGAIGSTGRASGTCFFPKNMKDAVHEYADLKNAIRYTKMFKKSGGVLTGPRVDIWASNGERNGAELLRDAPIPDTIRRYLEYQAYRVSLRLGNTHYVAFEHLAMVLLDEKYLEWEDAVNIVRGH
jgi:hypothetical protein